MKYGNTGVCYQTIEAKDRGGRCMKIYIVVTKKTEVIGSSMLEETIDKIELFKNAEDAVNFYLENPSSDIIARELEV